MFNVMVCGQVINVNRATRRVRGVLTLEIKDKTNGWVMDYEESKPYFVEWSNEIFNATGGKSYGNLRLMHQLQNIGKVPEALEFDDANKKIYCYGEVSDDASWEKVLNGELCGFSWSGVKVPPTPEVLRKWAALPDGAARYIGRPSELSLVDNPNQRGAYFEVVNAAGIPTFTIENEDGTEEVKEIVQNGTVTNTSLYDITSLAAQIRDINYTYTGSPETQIKLNKAIMTLLEVLAEMAKTQRAEFKETNTTLKEIADEVTVETAANAAKTGDNEMAEAVFNAAQQTELTNLVNQQVVNAVGSAVGALDFKSILEPIVNAAIAPFKAQIETILENTPVASTTVSKEVDTGAGGSKAAKPEIVANAAQGISEKDAKALNLIAKMHVSAKTATK